MDPSLSPERQALMRMICWDYDVLPAALYAIVRGSHEPVGHIDQAWVLRRMMERLSWYDLLDLLGIEFLREHMTEEVTARIRVPELREQYDMIRNVLQGKPVSFTGWDPRYRERVRGTLLSHRRYGP